MLDDWVKVTEIISSSVFFFFYQLWILPYLYSAFIRLYTMKWVSLPSIFSIIQPSHSLHFQEEKKFKTPNKHTKNKMTSSSRLIHVKVKNWFFSLNVSKLRKFSYNKVQGQNRFLKNMDSTIQFTQRNLHFKTIKYFKINYLSLGR